MIQYKLFIKARFCTEILERILRVVRHRGFQVYSMNSYFKKHNNKIIHIEITIISNKSINLLILQLNKLIDIIYIDV